MNQVFTASFALVIALILWSRGKKPKLSSLSTSLDRRSFSGVSSLTTTKQRTNQEKLFKDFFPSTKAKNQWEAPQTAYEATNLRKKLLQAINGGPDERLEAVEIAAKWGDHLTLPLLKRGLKDSDHRIVLTAASAFRRKRGIPIIQDSQKNNQDSDRLPRNVALMRYMGLP